MSAERAKQPPTAASAPWRVVCARELRDLWIGGKALHLIFLYTILLGLYSFLLASNVEVNLLPVKEMIQEVVKTAIVVCLLMSMIVAADGITAERERATLEGLLLTPASRTQIVFGKYLAAVSTIPAALAITVPYLAVLSKDDPVFRPALLWLFLLGGLLVPALAAMGMLVSIWCNNTKISMAVTFALFLLMLLPSEIVRPGKVMTAGELRKALVFQSINPIDAITKFLGRVLVLDAPPGEHWLLLTTPALIGVVVLVLLFAVAGPRLSLESTAGHKLRALFTRAARAVGARAPQPRPAPGSGAREPELVPPREALLVPTAPAPRAGAIARASAGRVEPSPSAAATWWVVFKRELGDLWVGGKALNFTLFYTALLGGYAYWQSHDSAVSLMPPKEMVFELQKVAMMVAVFMGLIIGADSLSGERERSTLESLLHTPASRRQIVVGKFLAAASNWPMAMIITVPYAYLLAQGDEVFGQAVIWTAIIGSVLVPAFTALGMLVSFWCANNKSSMFVSLSLYLIFLLPTQLQGRAQGGFMGLVFQGLNPLAGTRHFLAGILVNNRTVGEYREFLVSTVVMLVVTFVLLFWYCAPALHLDAGRAPRRARACAAAAVLIACLIGFAGPAVAAPPSVVEIPLQISIDKSDTVVRAGTPVAFNTVVTNPGAEPSRPVIVAMNIINLDKQGEVVDPEDWSPQRTQYVEPLTTGQATTLAWRVNAILDGDFMVYIVAIPAPAGPAETSLPVASSGIHLTVTPYTKLNPGGVLPYAIGGPALVAVGIFVLYRIRRRQTDAGEVS
jgi:ABC-2 type transport system permease protein